MTRGDRPRGLLRAWLWVELILLYFGGPALLALLIDPSNRLGSGLGRLGLRAPLELPLRPQAVLFPALWGLAAALLVWMLLSPSFDRRRLWNWGGAKGDLPRILGLWSLGAVLLFGLTLLIAEDRLFALPRNRPLLMAAIAVAYPILSVIPQQITHRTFFFHRYGGLVGVGSGVSWPLIAVNAVAFAWMHVVMWNWVAIGLTLPGGVLFAWTYLRTRSSLASAVEHALYGLWVFAVGLGAFLFTGAIGR